VLQATALGRRRLSHVFFPELEPSYQVTLRPGVRYEIRAEIDQIRRDFGPDVETGGWLLSDPRRPDNLVLATDPGDGVRVTRTSVELSPERFEVVERAFPHLRVRGDYHLHPNGDPVPSVTDRRPWMRGCEPAGGFWVGIIATPARSMFGEPELHGWVTCGTGGTMFCEPLRIGEL
jgi:proteasome lid subunit RPN8/RPN11